MGSAAPCPSNLSELLLLTAGLLVVNVAFGAAMWAGQRTPVSRALFFVWAFSLLSMLIQGLVDSDRWMILAFAFPAFGITLNMADLYRRALGVRARWRLYVACMVLGLGATGAAMLVGAPFWVRALPVSVASGVPLFDVILDAVRGRSLPMMARLAVGAALIYAIHLLDYPFLRTDPRFATLGFVIAILTGFAIAIAAPAMILERTVAEKETLQREVVARERLAALGEAAAVVAHEVRNPLGVLANVAELLRREPVFSERVQELLAIQSVETVRLDRLVEDLLVIAKPIEPRLAPMDLVELLTHAISLLRPLADESAVKLELAAPTASVETRGDPHQIQLAVTNLLRNAIEASPRGGTVKAAVVPGSTEVRILVTDQGSGVPVEILPRLFDPFFTTRAKGSGLGLAIVDRVMKAHHGSVRAVNLPDGGAQMELVFAADGR